MSICTAYVNLYCIWVDLYYVKNLVRMSHFCNPSAPPSSLYKVRNYVELYYTPYVQTVPPCRHRSLDYSSDINQTMGDSWNM